MMVLIDEKKANRARRRIYYLISSGTLIRPRYCPKCGKETLVRAHHEDYDEPLEIQWVCSSCHSLMDTANHKPKKRGRCNDGRGNRPKTERNQRIWDLWQKGWRQRSIANMLKMKESAVSMVILRERKRRKPDEEGE
jgi:ribosomal protein S27AE